MLGILGVVLRKVEAKLVGRKQELGPLQRLTTKDRDHTRQNQVLQRQTRGKAQTREAGEVYFLDLGFLFLQLAQGCVRRPEF